jgi:acetyltransferase
MRLSISPNQAHNCHRVLLRDGTTLEVRPICPEDEPLLAAFHFTLSEESVYSRYFAFLDIASRINHERLTRQCSIDYDRDMAYVALMPGEADPATGERSPGRIVGVGRIAESDGSGVAEIAVIVSDAFQHHGIGSTLVRYLIDFAREKRFVGLKATLLPENGTMRQLLEHEGFTFLLDENGEVMKGQKLLK